MAAEAAGQGAGRQCRFGHQRLRRASISLPIGARSNRRLPLGTRVAVALDDDAGRPDTICAALSMAAIWVSPRPPCRIDVQPHGNATPLEAEHRLAVLHARGADAARTQDAAVVIEADVRMGGVDAPPRQLVRLGRRDHAETVAERLQLAIAAGDAIGTGMVALDEQHLDHRAPVRGEQRRVVLHHHAVDGRASRRRRRCGR